jgi:hypothetical protein
MKHPLALTIVSLAAFAGLLSAADFWNSKPFSNWSEKETQKMLNDSPWAKKVSISMEGPTAPSIGGSAPRGGGGRGGAPGGGGGDEPSAPLSEKGNVGGGGGPQGPPPNEVVIRWVSARPMKEAVAKLRYGKEVETSDEAKAFLAREEMFYVVGVMKMPTRGRTGDEYKEALLKSAALTAKGKDSIAATDVQISPQGRFVEIYLLFPRQRAFSLDDSEVEFTAKPGGIPIKQKFRLKDMMVNGKLEI